MQAAYWITVGVLCLAPTFGWVQKPRPCQAPPLYSGSMFLATQNEQLFVVGNYSYDAFNQRIHLGEIGIFNNNSFTYDALMLFRERVLYEIDYYNLTCVKKPLESDFHPMEVPEGAGFVSQVVLGTSSLPGLGLQVNTWWGDMPDKKGHYLVSFTELGCLPVSGHHKTQEMGWVSVSYYDNILGVENPNVFIPPPFCEDAKLEVNEDRKKTDFFSVFH